MQLFMHNIPFAVPKISVQLRLADVLHKPPFPLNPPINFALDIWRSRDRSKRLGRLTLPTEDVAATFLRLYSRAISFERRIINFSPERTQDHARISQVRTTAWEDPRILEDRKRSDEEHSEFIEISGFSFGRVCRNGSYSPEVDHHGSAQIKCDIISRSLCVQITNTEPSTAPSLSSLDDIINNLFGQEASRRQITIRYPASSITAMAYVKSRSESTDHSSPSILLESNVPPQYESLETSTLLDVWTSMLGESKQPVSQRTSSFNATLELPPVHLNMQVSFNSHASLDLFLERGKRLNLPRAGRRSISTGSQGVYSTVNMERYNTFVKVLPFPSAYALEKAFEQGLLEPLEIAEMLHVPLLGLHSRHSIERCGSIIRFFTSSLHPASLLSPALRKSHRAGKKTKTQARTEALDLVAMLSDAEASVLKLARVPLKMFQPSPAEYQSYQLILTPTGRVLEGPLPDQSNSLLRRLKNHECFIRVSFQDERRSKLRRDSSLHIDELLETRYKRALTHGLLVAGRQFDFLGYSMSGLKEHTVWFVTPFSEGAALVNAELIRERLGDFDLISHKPALLAARWSQHFSSTDPTIELKEDEINWLLPDRTSTKGSVMTDGSGTISFELARSVYRQLQQSKRSTSRSSNIPSLFQIRLAGAKGVVVVDKALPGRVICIRPSQIKFQAPGIRTLDIAATSRRPMAMYFNRPLLVLLEHMGVSQQRICELQEQAIHEGKSILYSYHQASEVMARHGLGSSYRLPSLFKNLVSLLSLDSHDGLRDSILHTALVYASTFVLREIKYRAHIPVPGSFTLIGAPDETGSLKEGEIFATVRDEGTGLYKEITGPVLITRSPQIHPGDCQVVTAVRYPELEHLTNVVVFSCQGDRSLPSCLGGGDTDGDSFNLILDPQLLPKNTFEPGAYIGLRHKETQGKCTIADIADFVIDYIKTDLVGYISILHLRISDYSDEGPSCQACLTLAEKASHAVDFPKTGASVDFKSLPRAPSDVKPDFLATEGQDPKTNQMFYPSKKLLGTLFRKVPMEDCVADVGDLEDEEVGLDLIAHGLGALNMQELGVPSDDMLAEIRNILDAYCEQFSIIAKEHSISKRDHLTEAELISGTIQAKWSDHRKRREAVAAMNLQTQQLTKAVRGEFASQDIFYDAEEEFEYEDDFDEVEDLEDDEEAQSLKLQRAWCGFIVSREEQDRFGAKSFGLVAVGVVLDVIRERKMAE